MASRAADNDGVAEPVLTNTAGRGRFIILCDHATNHIPDRFRSLGLAAEDLSRHIAWDPGALAVARLLADALDAPLVHATVSRLVIDVNRSPTANDSIAETSEDTLVPGNRGIGAEERRRRIAMVYEPYHRAIERLLGQRRAHGLATALVAIHSFTPVYRGASRPWHVGVLHDEDIRLADPLIAALAADHDIMVGDNEPYSPADGVYHTLERHRRRDGLAAVMVEIRNDLIAAPAGVEAWAKRLARALEALDVPAAAA